MQALLADGLDVKKDFYAANVGSPTADSTASVTAAVKAMADLAQYQAQYEARASLHFPIGVYRLTQSAVLSTATNATDTFGGALFSGEGEGSVLWLDCNGATQEMWLYDNGPNRRSYGNTYQNLAFAAGTDWKINAVTGSYNQISDYGNGFRFTGRTGSGAGGESAHKFFGCTFRTMRTALDIEGADNADVLRVIGGDSQSCVRLLYINNPASYQNAIDQFYAQYHYGPIVEFGPNASQASVNMRGGQMVLASETAAIARWGVPVGVLAVQGGPGTQSYLCDFDAIRWELYGNAKLFDCRAGSAGLYRFSGSARNTNSAAKVMGIVGGDGVTVKLVDFASDDGGGGISSFQIASTLGFKTEAKLSIEGESVFSSDALDAIAFTSTGGHLHIGTDVSDLPGATNFNVEPQIKLQAVDRFAAGYSSSRGRGRQVKVAHIHMGGAPDTQSGVVTQLPAGATIVAVKAKIPAAMGVAGQYRMFITNGDKSTVYASSASAPQSAGHTAIADNILLGVGTNANNRLIRLYADDGAGGPPPAGSGSAPIEALLEWY
ncbi:hypothetical protein D9601_02380 [Sphingomonas sp. MA1305]|nr:hypothetical protein [Sphingomonas sp. MA1305]